VGWPERKLVGLRADQEGLRGGCDEVSEVTEKALECPDRETYRWTVFFETLYASFPLRLPLINRKAATK